MLFIHLISDSPFGEEDPHPFPPSRNDGVRTMHVDHLEETQTHMDGRAHTYTHTKKTTPKKPIVKIIQVLLEKRE